MDDTTISKGQDLIVRHWAVNDGKKDASGTYTAYFASKNKVFDKYDVRIDTDHHGTLSRGEHDTNEYEKIHYSSLPGGRWYLIPVIDPDNKVFEGNTGGEGNNVGEAVSIFVYGNDDVLI